MLYGTYNYVHITTVLTGFINQQTKLAAVKRRRIISHVLLNFPFELLAVHPAMLPFTKNSLL